MKFLCIGCDHVMDFAERQLPGDGTMAAVLVDLGFPVDSLNGFFILSRTIGLIGHWVDQKRQDSRLIRLFDYLVNYAAPKRREVPPLK